MVLGFLVWSLAVFCQEPAGPPPPPGFEAYKKNAASGGIRASTKGVYIQRTYI